MKWSVIFKLPDNSYKKKLNILSCGFIQALHFQYAVHKNKIIQSSQKNTEFVSMVLLPNNKLVFSHIVNGKATELLYWRKIMKTVKVMFWLLVRVVGLGHVFWAHIWGIGPQTLIMWRRVGNFFNESCHFSKFSYLLLQWKLCLLTSHLQFFFVKTVKIPRKKVLFDFRIKKFTQ